MAREIKFRGKNSKTKQWVYGDLLHVGNGFIITTNSELGEPLPDGDIGLAYSLDEIAVVIPETVGQFTGLLDKSGKEIYEGDIIFSKKCDCRAILHKVEYNVDNAMFVAKPIQGWDFDFCQIRKDWIDKYGKEVIGNVFDNPEPMEGE